MIGHQRIDTFLPSTVARPLPPVLRALFLRHLT